MIDIKKLDKIKGNIEDILNILEDNDEEKIHEFLDNIINSNEVFFSSKEEVEKYLPKELKNMSISEKINLLIQIREKGLA